MFEFKPDFEKTRQRVEAFWQREVLDRPVTMFPLYKPESEQVSLPVGSHADWKSRWLDIQYQLDYALVNLSNQRFLGDTLPIVYPNLGPEVFSAFYGCPLHYGGEGTTWTDPILHNWDDVDKLILDWNSPHLKWLLDMTGALLDAGSGMFITGMPDWHPGGDAVAAFRDPANLAVDMLEHKEEVKTLLARIEPDYYAVYDLFYEKLRSRDMPITTWLPLFSYDKYYVPSNDFSIMISRKMYDEVFLPGIICECQFYDHSIYHLDGPGALRHLDSILSIPELHALQWVPGAGNEVFSRWIDVYQRAQHAGKGIQVSCHINEIPEVMETLDPCGMFLLVAGVPNAEAGEQMLTDLEAWTSRKARRIAG
jgi:hypothetical protein